MSLLWPSRTATNPSVIGRLGRLVHWIAAPLGALLFLAGIVSLFRSEPDYFLIGVGLFIFAAGRAVRYLLASE